MYWFTGQVFCAVYLSLLPLVCAQGAANISVEAWIVVGVITFGTAGVILIVWVVFTWRVCRVYCFYRKENREFNAALTRRLEREERYRRRQPHVSNAQLERVALRSTGSPFFSPSQARRAESLQPRRESTTLTSGARSQTNPHQHRLNQIPHSPSNGSNVAMTRLDTSPNIAMAHTSSNSSRQPEIIPSNLNLSGIVRSGFNLHGVSRSSSNSSGFGGASTSNITTTGVGLHKPTNALSSHTSNPSQMTRLKITAGPSSQLQSLSEVEEMDVRPEEGLQGPPRYSYLFPETNEQDAQTTESRYTSPFSFNSERRGSSRHTGRLQEFNQLSSWPNFKY